MLNKKDIEEIIVNVVSKYQDIIENHQKRKYDGYASNNQNIPPLIDKLGRLHAPHDGYLFDDVNAYNKGEFLPDLPDKDFDELFYSGNGRQETASRIKILSSQKELFQSLNEQSSEYITTKFGNNEWYDQFLDSRCLYVYMSGPVAKMLTKEIIDSQEKLLSDRKLERKNTVNPLEQNSEAVIKGEIVGVRTVEDTYASNPYGGTVFKNQLGVKLETGNIVYGTLPKKIADTKTDGEMTLDDHLKGKKVEMIAAISPSQNDPTNGYFKSAKQIRLFDENDVEISLKKPKATSKMKP